MPVPRSTPAATSAALHSRAPAFSHTLRALDHGLGPAPRLGTSLQTEVEARVGQPPASLRKDAQLRPDVTLLAACCEATGVLRLIRPTVA